MEPITTAIVAALAAGAVSDATKVGVQVIVDAYGKLKEIKLDSPSARNTS